MGIEPTLSAWEAEVLPLNYTRMIPVGTSSERLIHRRLRRYLRMILHPTRPPWLAHGADRQVNAALLQAPAWPALQKSCNLHKHRYGSMLGDEISIGFHIHPHEFLRNFVWTSGDFHHPREGGGETQAQGASPEGISRAQPETAMQLISCNGRIAAALWSHRLAFRQRGGLFSRTGSRSPRPRCRQPGPGRYCP